MKALAVKVTPQQWADRVNARLGSAVESIIEAGRELIAAKASLKHGEWNLMFDCARPIRMGIAKAEQLMAVARHPVLGKSDHGQILPSSWRTLYELTKVDEPVLRKALSDGRVHPGMERSEVSALRELQRVVVVPKWDFTEAHERLLRASEAEFSRWGATDEEKPTVAYVLRQIAKGLEV